MSDNDDFNFDEFDEPGFDDEMDFPDLEGMDSYDDDLPNLDFDDEDRGGGGNRTFIIIAGVMILLFVVGLVAILLIGVGDTGPSDAELTVTAVVMANLTVEAQLLLTDAANNELMTQTALALQFTATPSPTATNTRPPTVTPTPTLDQTALAATDFAALTLTAGAATEEPTVAPTTGGVDPNAVALTATELARLLNVTPTDPPPLTLVGPGATELPDTGLFDELGTTGVGGVGVIALAAFGLLGVIIVSRRIRAGVNKDDE